MSASSNQTNAESGDSQVLGVQACSLTPATNGGHDHDNA